MIKRLKYSITALMLFLSLGLFAQRPEVEMADVMRSNGKIYVVVAILAIIFAVITIYLVSIDRKIGKLEKDSEK
jgi:hypothetical protein